MPRISLDGIPRKVHKVIFEKILERRRTLRGFSESIAGATSGYISGGIPVGIYKETTIEAYEKISRQNTWYTFVWNI